MSTVTIPQALQIAVEHHRAGRLAEAENIYRQILQVDPNNVNAVHFLGSIAHQVGNNELAQQLMSQAIAMEPQTAWRYNDLGEVHRATGRIFEAIEVYQTAVRLDPTFALAFNNMGIAYAVLGRLDEAAAAFTRAGELQPTMAEAFNNLGNSLQEFGRLDEAIPQFEKAISVNPSYVSAHDNLLMSINYHDRYTPADVFREHLRWAKQHAESLRASIAPHTNDRDPARRIRIGYISPDFREHAVSYFLESVMANHDHAQFEVFSYSDSIPPDEFTARFQSYSDHWRNILGMRDEQAADLVREDRIDILVDLAGHTSKNRLMVFARKPAPVQVTYLGYPNTTGLATMDYRITDAILDPPGLTEGHHTEALIRINGCFICYRPPENSPPVNDLPSGKSGNVTFGSFNRLDKSTPPMLDAWSKILKAVPDSRLLMKANGLSNDVAKDSVRQRFAAAGIGADRLELRGREWEFASHIKLYNNFDIALDTFPYNGTTTTCESLWMGVPVVTLAGQTHVSRVGLTLLSVLDLTDWIAHTPEEYIATAVRWAGQRDKLAALRADLRESMAKSRLTDAPAFTRDYEKELRAVWVKWCEQNSAAQPS